MKNKNMFQHLKTQIKEELDSLNNEPKNNKNNNISESIIKENNSDIKNNPLYPYIENVPMTGESFKEFINIANNTSLDELNVILPHLERLYKFYKSNRKRTFYTIYQRKADVLKSLIQFTKEIIRKKSI